MRKSKDFIEHEGIVTDLTEYTVTVEILSKSACSSCHAKRILFRRGYEGKVCRGG